MIQRIYKGAAKKISASRYGQAVVGGQKLSGTKLKKHIVEKIKAGGISSKKLEKALKEEGMTKSQLAKRRRLIKTLTGNDVEKLSKKEERRMAERVKMRIAAARRTSEMGDKKPSGMAAQLKNKKAGKEEALSNAMTTGEGADKTKVGMGSLGIQGRQYSVGAKSGPGGPGPSSGPSSAGSSGPPIGFNKMG